MTYHFPQSGLYRFYRCPVCAGRIYRVSMVTAPKQLQLGYCIRPTCQFFGVLRDVITLTEVGAVNDTPDEDESEIDD